ncbi:outer membrane efflux protein [Leptospira ryugenii]|uniref:Outer membrane efflux protein n=1 Tax=Leptospira ryugenii TaxID=1917863 RepID=A0A2P2E5F3_9LEPT|nr:outer membrane efflux protein [Leptospira ryugenii]
MGIFLKAFEIHPNSTIAGSEPLVINMEEAEGIGLTNSVILASLKDRREVFKMIATEKWRNYLPRVGISYFGLKNANVNQPDSQYNDIRVQLNQLLYDGGENALEIESAKLQEMLNGEDWKIAKERLLLDVRKAYLRLLASEVKFFVAEKSYLRTLKQLNDAKAERREGFLTELQELEISNKLHELELNLIKAKSQHSQNEIELKKQMNLPLEVPIRLKDSLIRDYVLLPPNLSGDEESLALDQKPEVKKSKLAIENLKTRKEITENYWKPKLFVGGYYGQNINGALPVKNDVYGFSFTVQTQLGSSTNQTSTNYGIQTDGTGIQRIPGFGPQFVGRGENAFNSNTLNLFEDLSYSRKIYEGKIALSDAVRSNQLLEVTVQAEAFKAKEKLKESWKTLSVINSKFLV